MKVWDVAWVAFNLLGVVAGSLYIYSAASCNLVEWWRPLGLAMHGMFIGSTVGRYLERR